MQCGSLYFWVVYMTGELADGCRGHGSQRWSIAIFRGRCYDTRQEPYAEVLHERICAGVVSVPTATDRSSYVKIVEETRVWHEGPWRAECQRSGESSIMGDFSYRFQWNHFIGVSGDVTKLTPLRHNTPVRRRDFIRNPRNGITYATLMNYFESMNCHCQYTEYNGHNPDSICPSNSVCVGRLENLSFLTQSILTSQSCSFGLVLQYIGSPTKLVI